MLPRGFFLIYHCLLIAAYYIHSVNSQLSSTGNYLPSVNDALNIQTYHIPAPPFTKADTLSINSSKPFRFAKSIPVSISFPSKGTISIVEKINSKGDWRWRIKIRSAGALSLSFIFDRFWIPDGSELYVYNNKVIDIYKYHIMTKIDVNDY
jgi:hypothetical protein